MTTKNSIPEQYPRGKVHFKNLDALRFLAFLPVFLHHSNFHEAAAKVTENQFLLWLIKPLTTGGLGVSFFFVLSGFLITFLLLKEHEEIGKINLSNFYIRRILRIWPLYFLIIFAGFFAFPLAYSIANLNSDVSNNLFYSMLFLTNFDIIDQHPKQLNMLISITWSVSIEEQF